MKDRTSPNHLKLVEIVSPDEDVENAACGLESILAEQRAAMRVFQKNLRKLPNEVHVSECLALAARLIDEAAYTLAQDRPGREAAQLFLIAASLETEVERVSGARKS